MATFYVTVPFTVEADDAEDARRQVYEAITEGDPYFSERTGHPVMLARTVWVQCRAIDVRTA